MKDTSEQTSIQINKKGVIVRSTGGFYYVASDSVIYECRARGRFRKDGQIPLTGDTVLFRIDNNKTIGGYIEEIFDRKNQLARPPVANIDQICLVVSLDRPRPDLVLVDKLLVNAHRQNVDAILIMNKADVAKDDISQMLERGYEHLAIKIFRVSANQIETLCELRNELIGKISCFTGQSAVGKSSILNALSENFEFKTGEIIKKTGRGKQTTRTIELRKLDDDKDSCTKDSYTKDSYTKDSYIMDTPGFAVLEVSDMEDFELQDHYIDIAKYKGLCRFDDCMHVEEPGCAVKNAIDKGELPNSRYQRYLAILEEIRQANEKKYK